MVRKINEIKSYMTTVIRSAICYFKELYYYLKSKRVYLSDNIIKNNPAMYLRKRTHHLERYLFSPNLYPKDYPIQIAAGIKNVIETHNNLCPKQLNWSKRILKEYEDCKKFDKGTCCAMLENNAVSKMPSIDSTEMLKLIKRRRSRRIFENELLTEEQKKLICEVAQAAPSSCNRQTLSLIFIENSGLKEFIASTIPGGYQFFAKAPCILILISEAGDYRYPDDRYVPYIDAAAAVQNIYLLCETMGLGCCWGSYTSFGSVKNEKKVRDRIKIPETHLIVASLAIGKSRQFVCDIPRDKAENRYWTDRYGG